MKHVIVEQAIFVSACPRWNGTANVPMWPCSACGDCYDAEDDLVSHIRSAHPDAVCAAGDGVDGQRYRDLIAYVESLPR